MTISKEDFDDYESVRESGATNMFDVRTVCMLSGLERAQVIEIMKTYDALKEKFGGAE